MNFLNQIYYIFISLRPKQWVKNFFIFLPLLFSKKILNFDDCAASVMTFFIFSLFSGAVYLFNDILDYQKDRLHPYKRLRPIAAGKLTVTAAWFASLFILVSAVLMSSLVSIHLTNIALVYFSLNIAYSLKLKKVVILDVLCIAAGFVLRVVAGSVVIAVKASHWLLMCAFLISIFIGFCKRRAELTSLNENANSHREVLEHYNTAFLDQMIVISTSTTVMSYALYTMSEETVQKFSTENLIYTVPFVLYGIFRYLYIVYKKKSGLSPTEALLRDFPIIICVAAWFVLSGAIIFRVI